MATTIYQGREFRSVYDQDSGAIFSDIELRRCHFVSCALSIAKEPRVRSTFRNVRLVDCSQQGCSLEAAIVEDCLVDGFDTSGQLLQIWGAVFNRVVLCGKIGRLMISWVVDMVNRRSEVQRAFDTANSDYYRGVDWALDISRGEFKELDIRGISASLIRRDPETQVVVTREKAIQGAWRELEFKVAPWRASLGLLLECEQSDIVLVVPKQHRRFREYLADLQLLRKAGVAEPD